MTPKEVLQRYWHYADFRPLQAEIIASVLAGKDTLALMPTGGGKSLCFQVPTMVLCHNANSTEQQDTKGRDIEVQNIKGQAAEEAGQGLCLVVTPLIALMKDQVENLRQHDILAAAIYTGMTFEQQRTAIDNCLFGPYHFLYVSPERLESEDFRKRLCLLPIRLIAIDEAHCISQWGYDFRPSYLHIADIRTLLPDVPILALTATATPDVVDDIQEQLHFREKCVLKKSFHRDNLQYIVRFTEKKDEQVLHILRHVAGSAIVYVRNRKRAKDMAEWLQQQDIQADYYHAGLTPTERSERQSSWKRYNAATAADATRVMVCTNAFGMGIDKPDVRLVIHYDLPDSLEAYYQEAGRGGRDGQTAYAVLLYNSDDKAKARKRVSTNFPPKEFMQRVYDATCNYLQIGLGGGYNSTFALHIDDLCTTMHLPLLQTYSAMHLLAQAGYIAFEEEHEMPVRVRIDVRSEEIRHASLNAEQEHLLDMLMRNYTGIFTDFQCINEEVLLRLFKTKQHYNEVLIGLAQRGMITFIPRTVACQVAFLGGRQDIVFLPPKIYEERQTQYATRLASMVEYAEQKQFCREQLLLAYFGENDAPPCGHCDVCREKRKG